jgi:hypothetical protein
VSCRVFDILFSSQTDPDSCSPDDPEPGVLNVPVWSKSTMGLGKPHRHSSHRDRSLAARSAGGRSTTHWFPCSAGAVPHADRSLAVLCRFTC